MMRDKRDDTHISIELFNGCEGTCHGCMLTPTERSISELKYNLAEMEFILDRLKEYGETKGVVFRPVYSFGDFFSLPILSQESFLNIAEKKFGKFAMTTTLVDPSLNTHYQTSLELLSQYQDVIIDVTVDPFRAMSDELYLSRIRNVVNSGKGFHLQILASHALMLKHGPEYLAEFCSKKIGTNKMFIAFTPTIDNLKFKQYCYDVSNALEYADIFYKALSSDFLESEIARFTDHDDNSGFADFNQTSFFIGTGFSVFLMSTTMYGDVLFDRRNGSNGIGNLKNSELIDILHPLNQKILMAEAVNSSAMMSGGFDCMSCKYYRSCLFNGVGLARRHYKDFEAKVNGCYGPKGFNIS